MEAAIAEVRDRLGATSALVQPLVVLGRARIIRPPQLGGELFAVVEAGIDADQLHQVDDRAAPVELIRAGLGVEHFLQVHFLHRLRLRLRLRRGRLLGLRGGSRRGRLGGGGLRRAGLRLRLGGGMMPEDGILDGAEDTHGLEIPLAAGSGCR